MSEKGRFIFSYFGTPYELVLLFVSNKTTLSLDHSLPSSWCLGDMVYQSCKRFTDSFRRGFLFFTLKQMDVC